MRLFIKTSLVLIALVFATAVAPSVKADPLEINTGGFWLNNLGNNGEPNGLDSLVGLGLSNTVDEAGTFIATLNDLSFTIGFTGEGSNGSQEFSFFQPLMVNGQEQMLEIFGRIEIGLESDSVHLLSSTPLTYVFDTFTVDVNIIPMSMIGENGAYYDVLNAEFVVNQILQEEEPVPEPATLTLLGLGLAGTAAKIRQRRRRAHLNAA